MKRALIIAALLFVASISLAQEIAQEPTQNPNVHYRVFNTTNIYTLLKLDTRDGRIWQVQWGDKDHRFIVPLNPDALVSGAKDGRFTLYPTKNLYTFILLDQDTGDAWHVQWGNKVTDRFVLRIKDIADIAGE